MAETAIRWISSGQQGIATLPVDISDVAVGETAIVALNIGSTSVTITPPAGWTQTFTKTSLGSRACVAYHFTKTDIDQIEAIFVASAATGLAHALIGILGALPANWIIGPVWTRAAHGTTTTTVVDGVTTTAPNSAALVLAFEATTALEDPNSIVGVDNGFTEIGYLGQGSIIETVWAGKKSIPVAGDVGDVTITYRNTQASNGAGVMIGFPEGAYIPPGALVSLGNGSAAFLSYIDSEGIRRAPASVRLLKPGFSSVEEFIATPGATMAHRGGSLYFPEMSEYAYDQAVLRGFGVLEFSAQRTVDGWWFGCHNPDLNEITGNTGLPPISTMTRAEVETYSNISNPTDGHPSRPFFGLEDFLVKYGSTHILMVDPKNALSFNNEFLGICENIVDKDRLIWKYTLGGVDSFAPSNAARTAYNRGWGGTWGYAYNTDVDSGAFAQHANELGWTILGMNIGAAQSYWDTALAVGKPVIGHIANSPASYAEAMAKGADMVQCSDTIQIQSVSI